MSTVSRAEILKLSLSGRCRLPHMSGTRTSRRLLAVAAIVAGAAAGGCTAEIAKRTGYEALHNVSDSQNDADPKYDPGPRPAYEVYRDQREQILKEK